MAIADMHLKMTGVTGEALDSDHKGEIQVIGWSWGLQMPMSLGGPAGSVRSPSQAAMELLVVTKRVDMATPTLMAYVRNNKDVTTAVLTVRKAGTTPLPYLKIELFDAKVVRVSTRSEAVDLIEQVELGFKKIRVTYTPQQSGTGAKGGGDVVFEGDAYKGL